MKVVIESEVRPNHFFRSGDSSRVTFYNKYDLNRWIDENKNVNFLYIEIGDRFFTGSQGGVKIAMDYLRGVAGE